MSASLSIARVETEIKSIVFASHSTFPGIEKWAQNSMADWWHPLTAGQRTKDNLTNVKVGDIIKFRYISKTEGSRTLSVKVLDVGGPAKYILLTQIYGHPIVPDWTFADVIRVCQI
jgi:hypothetical protein